jgi:putative ABC transport system permease protein
LLAINIAGCSAVAAIVGVVWMRPLNVRSPEQLATIEVLTERLGWIGRAPMSLAERLRERTDLFESVSMCVYAGAVGRWGGGTVEASRGWFEEIGVRPLAGSTPSSKVPWDSGSVVIGERLWRTEFGGRHSVIGARLVEERSPQRRIAGVVPDVGIPDSGIAIWTELRERSGRDYSALIDLVIYARLKPGLTVESAQDRLASTCDSELKAAGLSALRLAPLSKQSAGAIAPLVATLGFCLALGMLAACLNLAALSIGRTLSRWPEVVTRLTLGATAGRIWRMLLWEELLQASAAAVGAMFLASPFLMLILYFSPARVPRFEEIRIDLTALAGAWALILPIGLVSSSLPALVVGFRLRTNRMSLQSTYSVRARAFHWVIGALQAAAAIAVVLCASAVLEAAWKISRVDPGFRADGLYVADIGPPQGLELAEGARWLRSLGDRLEDWLGEVNGSRTLRFAAAMDLPGRSSMSLLYSPDPDDGRGSISALTHCVTTGYFETMGIPLTSGRVFTRQDLQGPEKAIVNQSMARRLWGIAHLKSGARVHAGRSTLEVIGVAGDVRHLGLVAAVEPEVYRLASRLRAPMVLLAVRSPLARQSVEAQATSALAPLGARLLGFRKMSSVLSAAYVQTLDFGVLALAFGVLSMATAGVGVFAIVRYAIRRRTREIGIRLALGAPPHSVVVLFLREAVLAAAAAILLGVAAGSLLLPKVVERLSLTVAITPAGCMVTATAAAVVLLACATLSAVECLRWPVAVLLRGEE